MIEIKKLIWNEWNVFHIVKHQVTPVEVEEASHSVLGVFKSYKGRWVVIGTTIKGRVIAIVLSSKGNDEYYVVTARDASKKERRAIK